MYVVIWMTGFTILSTQVSNLIEMALHCFDYEHKINFGIKNKNTLWELWQKKIRITFIKKKQWLKQDYLHYQWNIPNFTCDS